ncbi:MAG: DUF4199 domain-containing protein [Bacteroidia bacterium]|nr:DUF4199 domain-containing protein [Bacteroidia bacterium]
MKSKFGHATVYGLIGAMAVIILSLTLYLVDMNNSALNYLSYPVIIGIAVYGVKKWREDNGGYLKFGPTYSHLIIQTLGYSVLITIWTLIFMQVIAPGLMEDQLLIQQAKMEEEGMEPAQIEMAMSMARKFSNPGFIAIAALIGNMLVFGVIHLIVAAIVKKDPPIGYDLGEQFQQFPPQNNPPQA